MGYEDWNKWAKEFNESTPTTGGGETQHEPLPDGNYQVNVEKIEQGITRDGTTPKFSWWFRVISGPNKGRMIFKHWYGDNAERFGWLKTDFRTCGVEINNLNDLAQKQQALLDTKLEVAKKTNTVNDKVYENVYINRKINVPVGSAANDNTPF